MVDTASLLIDVLGATGLTRAGLAAMLGVDWKTVDRWARGEMRLSSTSARLLWLLARHPELADELRTEFGESL